MKEYIKNEVRRALFSRNALIVFSITFFSLLIAFLEFIHFPRYGVKELKGYYDAIDLFLIARSTGRASILIIIAPLLATLVFSDSYLVEKESGFLRFIYLRMHPKKYIWIKAFVNAVSSGIIISVASIGMLLLLVSLCGVNIVYLHEIQGPFSWIYYTSKFLYAIFIIAISFVFNVIFSSLGLGISPWINNKYLALLFPFFYYIVSGTIFEFFGINKHFSVNGTILFDLNPLATELNILIYQFILLAIGLGLFYFGVLNKHEKNI